MKYKIAPFVKFSEMSFIFLLCCGASQFVHTVECCSVVFGYIFYFKKARSFLPDSERLTQEGKAPCKN